MKKQEQWIREEDGNSISEVIVFTNNALIKRTAKVNSGKGLCRFLMEIKSFYVDNDSAQAIVRGQGEMLSVQSKKIPVKHAPQENLRELNDQKEKLLEQLDSISSKQDVISIQRKYLQSISLFSESEIPKKMKTRFPDISEMKALIEFLREEFQQAANEQFELDKETKEIKKELQVIESKLKQKRKSNSNHDQAIEILFDSMQEQEIEIEVSYVVSGAGWSPIYKVDVPNDLSTVNITLFASIEQSTGENWRDVNLSVSNAIPMKNAVLPRLDSWQIDLLPPPAGEGAMIGRKAKMSKSSGEENFDDDLDTMPMTLSSNVDFIADYREADTSKSPLAFEYNLTQKINLESGTDETILPLYSKEIKGEFYIYTVPKIDLLPYLVCRATPDSEMLEGRLNIHFDGRFVGSTWLSEKKAGEELLINLGAERAIKVQREKITDKKAETFFGVVDRSSIAREIEYRIVIENQKENKQHVWLGDQIPASKTDRIQVKGVELIPDPTKTNYQKREGVMIWEFDVNPGDTREVRIKFHVKHPKEERPYGL